MDTITEIAERAQRALDQYDNTPQELDPTQERRAADPVAEALRELIDAVKEEQS